jgi:hypothetical protein
MPTAAASRDRLVHRASPRLAIALLAALALFATATPALAGPIFEPWTDRYGWGAMMPTRIDPLSYFFNNASAGLEPGEPNEGGALTRSLWVHFTATAPARDVLHTVGSEVPTAMVVYTNPGTGLGTLSRVIGSTDVAVPGLPAGQSLIQFDPVPGTAYHIQVGTAGGGPGGDITLHVFQQAPDGGLAVLLSTVTSAFGGGPAVWAGRDYACTTTCDTPTFLLYNSRNQALDLSATTGFGPLFTTPAIGALAPRAMATVSLPAVANQDFSTPRTITGDFTFSGKVGGGEVARGAVPGRVFVTGTSGSTTLATAILPTSRAGTLGGVLTAFATAINSGSQRAIGCIVRSEQASRANVTFQETDPATNTPIGAPNQPVNIPPGGRKSFVFTMVSQSPQLGDPDFNGPVQIQCANAFTTGSNLASNFALTSLATVTVADMISIGATSTNDGIVNVTPATGGAFSVATVNIGVPAQITARATYSRPFGEDDPARQFVSFICETVPATGQCLSPPAVSDAFDAQPNVPHTYAVFVQPPGVNPGFDPGQRRIFVKFEQQSPPNFLGSNPIPLLVGSTSVAPRAQ